MLEGWYPIVSPWMKWLVWRKASSPNLYDFPIWLMVVSALSGWLQFWGKKQRGDNCSSIPINSHENETPLILTKTHSPPQKNDEKRLDSRLLVLSGQQILQAARCYHSHWKLLIKQKIGKSTNFEDKKRKEHHVHKFFAADRCLWWIPCHTRLMVKPVIFLIPSNSWIFKRWCGELPDPWKAPIQEYKPRIISRKNNCKFGIIPW